RQLGGRFFSAALERSAGPCPVDEEVAHDLSCEGEKVRAIGKVQVWRIHESQIGLMHHFTGAERRRAGRPAQLPVRQLPQSVVNEWDELIAGLRITRGPPLQEARDFRGCGRHSLVRGEGVPRYGLHWVPARRMSRFGRGIRFYG